LIAGASGTLVCDLVLPLGSLRWISGIQDTLDLLELTQLPAPQLTQAFIDERLQPPQGWSFRLLSGVQTPQDAEAIQAERITPMLQSMRSRFCNLSALARVVMAQADRLIVILQADEECVSNALAIQDFIGANGIDPEHIWFVTNRPLPSEGMTTDVVTGRLGNALAAAIPNMREQFALVNTLHAPLQLRFPEHRVNISIKRLADQLLVGEIEKQLASEPLP